MSKTKNTEWAKSLAEAERLTGITRQTLSAYKKDGCQAFKPNGRISLPELESWMALNGKEAGRAPSDLMQARIRLLTAQAVKTEHDNKIRHGEMVNKAEIRDAAVQIMTLVFDSLEKDFCQELPPDLVGLDAPAIAVRCTAAIDALRDELRERFSGMASEPQQTNSSEAAIKEHGEAVKL